MPAVRVTVAVEAPRHVALGDSTGLLDYTCERALAPGTLVRVPLGRREVAGVVWDSSAAAASAAAAGQAPGEPLPDTTLRPVKAVLDAMPPLSATWRGLIDFAAGYYQRSIGELALAVLPPELRRIDDTQLARRLKRLARLAPAAAEDDEPPAADNAINVDGAPAASSKVNQGEGATALTADQAAALAAFAAGGTTPALLHGVTGSGKTEVYLRAAADALAAGRQVLVLVPEINLTPQLEARFAARFPGRVLASLHSALTPAQRLRHWLLAHQGRRPRARQRLAVFASLPRLGLIVVDEEHDASFKQQEGARYSARDLAVWRAHQLRVPVLLGSATPSLETWQRVQEGRYRRLVLPERVGGGELPRVRLVDMRSLAMRPAAAPPPSAGSVGAATPTPLSPPLLAALNERIARGEQSLLLLNRRGYAPVLHCAACGWKSGCPHCSAWRVFHKIDRTLRCHHCGFAERVPRACPECGNLDITPLGRGTEKLEEQLAAVLPPGARIAHRCRQHTPRRRAGAPAGRRA
ncbi:MAG: primosomal protein N' [Rubrivivax sp.]